ncbi:MAG: hypothetical protein R3351_02685 [Nitrospirales bacterium]|nr:hypothetical protein [Nitrospirales bacterium]
MAALPCALKRLRNVNAKPLYAFVAKGNFREVGPVEAGELLRLHKKNPNHSPKALLNRLTSI